MKKIINLFKNLFSKLFGKKPASKLRITTPNGYIEIGGSREFVEPLLSDLLENSPLFKEFFADISQADWVKAMRESGFTEQQIKDWEEDNFWDDWIYEKKTKQK